MPASMTTCLAEFTFGPANVSGISVCLAEFTFGPANIAGMAAGIAETEFGPIGIASARQSAGEQLFGPEGRSAAAQSLAEVNSIPSQSPEKFRVWDGDKGQYVYAPRYIWTGTTWAEVGGNTVPSWKHPFLWTGT